MYLNTIIKTFLHIVCWLCASFTATQVQAFNDIGLNEKELNWLRAHPNITLAYDGYFPPYSFINDRGELEGFSVDVFRLLSDRLDISFQIHPETTWQNLYLAAQHREVDLVATMVKRPEREAWFNFSKAYIDKTLVIITQAEDQKINKREDLAKKTIALVKHYHYVPQILQDFPSATPYYVDTILDALTAVSIGDADAAITFLGAGHYYRTKYLLSNLKYAAVYDKTGSSERIAIRKDWPELQSILNKALESIPESKMQSLRQKWLPVEYLESLVEIELTEQEITWIKNHPTIRLGVDPEFAPFEYFENGRYAGMTSDYIRLLNQRLHLNMQVIPGLSWDQTVEKAKIQEIDVLPAVG